MPVCDVSRKKIPVQNSLIEVFLPWYNHNNMREFQLAVTALDCAKDIGLTLINTMKRNVYISPNSI